MRHNPPTPAELTIDELAALAPNDARVQAAADTQHGTNMARSKLRHVLRHELHAMLMRGELTLCTRTERQGHGPCPH